MTLFPSPAAARDRLVRLLVVLIGLHSCCLGLGMLLLPGFMMDTFRFPGSGSTFFPSQSGIFLLILGICYLLALREPALTAVILVSKALAVLFLAVHAAFLGAPPVIAAAAAGDGAMLVLLVWAMRRAERAGGG